MLLMDMGTGKTLTTLLALQSKLTDTKGLTTVILIPNALLHNWNQEFTKHFKDWTPRTVRNKRDVVVEGEINIIPFSIAHLFDHYRPDILIVDEAHTARNPKTRLFHAISNMALEAEHVWLLTGTPIVNHVKDLWSLERLTDSECHVIRTSKNDVLELPRKQFHAHNINAESYTPTAAHHLAQITETRIASANSSVKLKILSRIINAKQNTVVFTSFKSTALQLMKTFQTKLAIHGDLSMQQRNKNIQQFQQQGGLLIATFAAGGVGINLTNAHNVIILDPAWNPASLNQAIDRVHRMGLKHDINIHFLIHPDDTWIYKLVNKKQLIIHDHLDIQPNLPIDEEEVAPAPKRKALKHLLTKPIRKA